MLYKKISQIMQKTQTLYYFCIYSLKVYNYFIIYLILFAKLYIYLKYKKREKILKCNCILIYKKLYYLIFNLVYLNFLNFFKSIIFSIIK